MTMFQRLDELRDSLFAARMLREEILGQAVAPDAAARLRTAFLRENSAPGAGAALAVAIARGRTANLVVGKDVLTEIAAVVGSGDARTHAGATFHGKPAPAPSQVPGLFDELLETVNSPVAVESWPAPVRAFGLHFLLRLVQPFQGQPDVLGHAAEALVLCADGFAADHVLLAEREVGAAPHATKPDPDAFARERMHRFVERLGETRDRVCDAASRSMLAAWVERREARVNPRQRRLLRWLAERDGTPHIAFQDYVDLHAGRRAPSVRTLQRDFQQLRSRRLLRTVGDEFVLDFSPITFGA